MLHLMYVHTWWLMGADGGARSLGLTGCLRPAAINWLSAYLRQIPRLARQQWLSFAVVLDCFFSRLRSFAFVSCLTCCLCVKEAVLDGTLHGCGGCGGVGHDGRGGVAGL